MTNGNINTSKLKRKTILGFVVITVIFELFLFVPASRLISGKGGFIRL